MVTTIYKMLEVNTVTDVPVRTYLKISTALPFGISQLPIQLINNNDDINTDPPKNKMHTRTNELTEQV
jgi:hypothetical protein